MCTVPRAAPPIAMALLAAIATGCEEPPPPWAGQPDGEVVDESEPFLPSRRPLLRDGGAGGGGGQWPRSSPSDGPPILAEEHVARPSGRHGGLWLSCHDRFTVSGEPRRDVTRLALSCGPVTGMERASDLLVGTLDAGVRSGHRFTGRAGHCYRVFVAAAEGIAELDVRIADGRGEEIASHRTVAPWAALEPARPFCVTEDTPLVLSVDGRGQSGPFAAEVWSIPPRARGL